MGLFNKTMQVHTMYGIDDRLHTSYFEGNAVKAAKKHAKAFNKELKKYDKAFIEYASMDICSSNIDEKNTKHILDKLGIANSYIGYMPTGDIAEGIGEETTAIAANKTLAKKHGFGAKIAGAFQPFFEKQAEKHPNLKGISDRITKAANDGRMPLTAESAAMMKIAFDKKYYNDIRKPDADKDKLRTQYQSAMSNLMDMAAHDGVSKQEIGSQFTRKLIQQMQVDESLTDVYKGMATGDIRLGPAEAVVNGKGEPVKVKGKTLYKIPTTLTDSRGGTLGVDAFVPREPQTMDEILAEYKSRLDSYGMRCHNCADYKRMLGSDSYANIERNVKAFAEADCPDEAAKFEHEFKRTNLMCLKEWAEYFGNAHLYENLEIPPSYDEITKGIKDGEGYATSDDYKIDDIATADYDDVGSVYEQNYIENIGKTDEQLESDLRNNAKKDAEELSDIDKLRDEIAELRAQLAAYRAHTGKDNEIIDVEFTSIDESDEAEAKVPESVEIYHSSETKSIGSNKPEPVAIEAAERAALPEITDKPVEPPKPSFIERFGKALNVTADAYAVASMIREVNNSNDKTLVSTNALDNLKNKLSSTFGVNVGQIETQAKPAAIEAQAAPVAIEAKAEPVAIETPERPALPDNTITDKGYKGSIPTYGLELDFKNEVNSVSIEPKADPNQATVIGYDKDNESLIKMVDKTMSPVGVKDAMTTIENGLNAAAENAEAVSVSVTEKSGATKPLNARLLRDAAMHTPGDNSLDDDDYEAGD